MAFHSADGSSSNDGFSIVDSPNPSSLAANIRDIESKILEGKLVLLGDDGKPLKPSRLTRVEPSPHEERASLDLGTDSWGRLDFARALIGIRADRPLKDTMVIAIPMNSFAALNEHDKVFENVNMTKARNEGKICMNATKVVDESGSDVDDKESYDEDPYDDDDHEACDLTTDQMAFCDAWDINLCGKIRK
ncbi:hypothetical protein Tco_0704751 [Tanacetum coccineum]|uniref:Uncharacterized protein n=1 Tax=Tanacetum coccineum TaxID=301880 RepID=A0ABQ4Y2K3_9ASTR